MPRTWRSSAGDHTIVLSEECIAQMLDMARRHYPNEVGTSLIGRYSADGFTAFVQGAAPLAPDSKGSRMAFSRGVRGLRDFFHKLGSTSGEHYVGEWHSHPEGAASPSYLDNRSQSAIAADPKVRCPEVVLVIVGGNPSTAPELGVFVYSRRFGRVDLRPDLHGPREPFAPQ